VGISHLLYTVINTIRKMYFGIYKKVKMIKKAE
jgi:hypothetical protein